MFEQLGYKLIENSDKFLIYQEMGNEDLYIEFYKKDKTISGLPTYDYFLNIDLLKAINKQCEELGWL